MSTARSSSPSSFSPALICSVYVGVSPFFQPSMIHSDSSSPFVGPPSQIAWPQTTMRWPGGCMLMVRSQRLGQKEVQAPTGNACLLSRANVANQVGSCDRVQEWACETPAVKSLRRLVRLSRSKEAELILGLAAIATHQKQDIDSQPRPPGHPCPEPSPRSCRCSQYHRGSRK